MTNNKEVIAKRLDKNSNLLSIYLYKGLSIYHHGRLLWRMWPYLLEIVWKNKKKCIIMVLAILHCIITWQLVLINSIVLRKKEIIYLGNKIFFMNKKLETYLYIIRKFVIVVFRFSIILTKYSIEKVSKPSIMVLLFQQNFII